ncbi:uncharacterized protein C8A04DRAFT_26500 [Dichotomopilus funicola]|uniref:DUF8032 domain-containing protein n=1 Tax=Dichotomopilus funicola TaxID=1934379 RepID=A0AAN6V6G1_9PEZI|nr:hypothetical protein C8A04DRAFT_26500 [Dichotomopilus funicola]
MVVSSMQHHTHHQQQGSVPPHLQQHSRPSSVVHQQHHSQASAQQPPPQQTQHSSAYAYPQQNQSSNSQEHGLPYYAQASPYSTPGATSGYTSADTGDMMAATMQRPPYPPIQYHTPQSNSPASVASPSAHDQQRSMYAQPPSQLQHQSMYYGAPQQQYSSMPAQAAQSPYAQHAQQPHQSMGSQPGMMMSHTPPQHSINQHPSQHPQQGMTVSPRPDKIETHGLNHRISATSAPVAMNSASSASPQNGAPLSTPTTASGVNPNAAPGPIPATTPLVVRQDTNGVQWIAFEYSRDRVKMEYTIRCDVESVNQDELSAEFKTENCVYPRACCPKDQYRGNRLQYETECNSVGWALAQLNPPLRGKRGLIQRAVDSWRNSNQDPRLRSRRVRRMAKMNYRNPKTGSTTPHATHMPAGPGGPGSTGMTTPTGMTAGNNPAMGKPVLNNMTAQMHHHHSGQQDGSAPGGDEVGDGDYSDDQQHHHHHQQPSAQGGSGTQDRPTQVFTGYGSYSGAPHGSSMPSIHDTLGDAPHGGSMAPRRLSASRNLPDGPEDLFPDIPEAKKRKFILVEDSDRQSRLRVRVTLDGVDTREIPDSFRKSSSVYQRSYFPREMQSPPPSATGSKFFGDDISDIEDNGTTDTEGRRAGRGGGASRRGHSMVKVPMPGGQETEVAIPRMRRAFRGKEVRLNDLGYRMAWLQSRVFAGRTVFLQRALDSYRNKTRSAMESVAQDVKIAAPHYETRVGKRKFTDRMRLGEDKDE